MENESELHKRKKKRKRGQGEGSIYRMQDGRWRAAIMVGRSADGRQIRKIYTAATRHEVQDKLTDTLKDIKQGLPVVFEKQTVGDFLTHWLEQVLKPRVRPKTLRTSSDFVKNHYKPAFGETPLAKLSPQDVRQFVNAKLEADFSPKTVKHLLVTLRGALATAVKDGLVARNVASLVDPPRIIPHEPVVFNPEQARAFLDAVRGTRLQAAFTVAVAVGMRQGEILGLKWADVDLNSGQLNVRSALQRVEKKLIQVEPKSRKSRRAIQLPGVCVSALVRHQAKQHDEQTWAGTRWQDTGYVFTTRVGTPIDARGLLRDYYRVTRPKPEKDCEEPPKLAFPPIRFHDLRHSAATLLLAQGVSPRYISDLLGHSQVSFTLQTYAHVLPEVQKEVATKMDDILAPKRVATRVATKPVSEQIV
jgi:integrase